MDTISKALIANGLCEELQILLTNSGSVAFPQAYTEFIRSQIFLATSDFIRSVYKFFVYILLLLAKCFVIHRFKVLYLSSLYLVSIACKAVTFAGNIHYPSISTWVCVLLTPRISVFTLVIAGARIPILGETAIRPHLSHSLMWSGWRESHFCRPWGVIVSKVRTWSWSRRFMVPTYVPRSNSRKGWWSRNIVGAMMIWIESGLGSKPVYRWCQESQGAQCRVELCQLRYINMQRFRLWFITKRCGI